MENLEKKIEKMYSDNKVDYWFVSPFLHNFLDCVYHHKEMSQLEWPLF